MISLKEKYKDYFMVGAAVSAKTIKTHEALIVEHFNSITCENEMKFSSVSTKEGDYDFSVADSIYDFAKKNNIALRGHTFVWHNQTPKWVFENADRDKLLDRMKNHIDVIGSKYKDYIYAWDVVNEAVDDKNDEYLRKSEWLDIIGADFIEKAFIYAKSVVPEAVLFYNDYNETNPSKRDKICKLVKELLEKGAPISGVGLQCHWNVCSPTFDEIKEAVEKYAALGLKIHVTEMDVSLFDFNDKSSLDKPDEKLLQKQAEIYGKAFELFREYKEHMESVTLWGVADDVTWLDNFPVKNRKNWPLLFDCEHKPKEAFYRITDF